MKKVLVTVVIAFLLMVADKSLATDLRGRILRLNPSDNQYYPVPNVRVDMWIYNGAQWIDFTYAVTDKYGMYYFLTMSPGYNFQIQVNGRFCFYQPLYIANMQVQDIPQIII
jgi:hypothetical protein